MPIRVYQSTNPARGCVYCRPGFDLLQKMAAPDLLYCPECGVSVRRLPAAPALINSSGSMLSKNNLARHGFTQYQKVGKGEYEKSAGQQGPDTLKA
jgi:predicted nucleic acid-binding Zn ribbon protein